MFEELDTVVINHNIGKYGLKKDDIGTIVHVYKEGKAIEVEFTTAEGKTVAVLTLTPSDIRPMEKNEILHVREFATI